MTINRTDIDALNATLTVKIEKADYEENLNKTLKDYRKKAQVPGFRPGMVPMGMIQKIYGRTALVDEVLKQMNDSINKYLQENKVHALGELVPAENTPVIDFDTQDEFEFVYDMALAPEVKLELNKKIKLPYYTVEIADAEKQKYIDHYLGQHGSVTNAESVGEEKDLLKVDVSQEGETGIKVENEMLALDVIPEKKRKNLMGLKIGENVTLNIREILTNDVDCAAFLHVEKEKLGEIDPVVNITVKEIRRLQKAEMNQEFFDKVYGPGVVSSEAEFVAKIEEEIRKQLLEQSNYRFSVDVRKALLDLTKLELPEKTLKRWILTTSDGKLTAEQVEEESLPFFKDLRWQLVKNHIQIQNNIEVKEDDMIGFAKKMVQQQFAAYGLSNMPDENVTEYAKNILTKEKEAHRIYELAAEEKIIDYIKAAVTLTEKEISEEKFRKLFEDDNK